DAYFWLLLAVNATNHYSFTLAIADAQLDQLLRLLDFFRRGDLSRAQIDLLESIDADLREIRRYGLCGFDRWIRHRSSNVYGSVDAREERLGDVHRRAVGQAAPFECLAIDVVRIGGDAAQRFAHGGRHDRRDHDADDAQRFQRVPDDAR